jgi:hypothetical protein
MDTLKFCFTMRPEGLALLAHTREVHEALGATCTVAVEDIAHFELNVLTCAMPKKLNPVKFTRAL